MAVVELTRRAAQVEAFKTGNEMAALSASQIGFHVMGYYPITPSTEIAELLDEMKAEGEHQHGDGPGRRRARRRGHLLRSLDRRRPRLQRDELAGPPLLTRGASGAVGDAVSDAARPGDPLGQRPARHPRRPLRPLLRAQYRLAHLPRARPPGRLRPEPDRAARRRAARSPAAGDRRLRRLLHEPPEAARPDLRGRARRCRSSWGRCPSA